MTDTRPSPATSHGRNGPGFGLGLRTAHYADFAAGRQPVDWLEVVTDNFLVDGGKPLAMLDRFRTDYPIALHGVAMSVGTAAGIDPAYVRRVRALADRIDAMWVSDHLCWTGPAGRPMHDLYPLPYTEASARRVIDHVQHAQDLLRRRLVLENVSSYLRFSSSASTEWDFLAHVAREADCELLVDVNNVYVSSVNHGFDPYDYLRALPPERVRQLHLAGHSVSGDFVIDTHDHPVCPQVWDLYAHACALFGPTATLLERDDRIPPLGELLDELRQAREIAARSESAPPSTASAPVTRWTGSSIVEADRAGTTLESLQAQIGDLIVDAAPIAVDAALSPLLDDAGPLPGRRGLDIYRNAYRARLAEVLGDHFPKLGRYVGPALFEELAGAYVTACPPQGSSLGRYGDRFAELLTSIYPDDPVLTELADLEWAMRTSFDGPDQAAWDIDHIRDEGPERCLDQWPVLHGSVRFLTQCTNVLAIWTAIDRDEDVPAVEHRMAALPVMVWRKGMQPCFASLDDAQAGFLKALTQAECSIGAVAAHRCTELDTTMFASWLQRWWSDEIFLRRDERAGAERRPQIG